jgi:hypothetical protein
MEKKLSILIAAIVWFAVISQFYLMMENRVTDVPETTIRFFSFFTILTNFMTALYFTFRYRHSNKRHWIYNPGNLTALMVYILIVGLVYQFILRPIWDPTGLQKFVDELLHSINPTLVLLFWWLYEQKSNVQWKQISYWILYPLLYLFFILFRGNFSGFYPYPFVDVSVLGLSEVLINSVFLTLVFFFLSFCAVGLGKMLEKP